MSVYKPKNSPYFHYDFVFKGRRVHGSTGVETRRRAEAIEREKRNQLAEGKLDDAAQMTLDLAAAKWWEERGKDLRASADRDRQVAMLISLLGANTRLVDIDTDTVNDAMQRRRKILVVSGKTSRPPSNATVNRDIIDALRPILRRARKSWGAKGLPEIDWGELRLAEPKAKPKELTEAEFSAFLGCMPDYWGDLARFCRRYAVRISEAFFPLSALDVEDRDNARVTLRNRKGGDDHVIPLLPQDVDWIRARLTRAEAAKLETIWFRASKTYRNTLYAMTRDGAVYTFRKAMTDSGLRASKGLKGSHDLRRDGAMKTLRATGNLRVTQRLLGHASIQSTLAYAHAIEDDVKAALAAVSRNSPGETETEAAKPEADQSAKKA